jgi:hypothetical protein
MGHGHKLVQSQPTDDGIEWEVDVSDIKDNVLRIIVLCYPEVDRQSKVVIRLDGILAYPVEWV